MWEAMNLLLLKLVIFVIEIICHTIYIAFLEYHDQIPNYANLIIIKSFQFPCVYFLCKRHFSFIFCDMSLCFCIIIPLY